MKKNPVNFREAYNAIWQWVVKNTNISERSAKWIAAMAAHETGRFTSAIFRENKNLFGMKQPKKRETYAIGTSRGHAVYPSYDASVRDFILYLIHFRNNPDDHYTLRSWISRLKAQGYFEDSLVNYERGTRSALDVSAIAVDAAASVAPPIIAFGLRGWSVAVQMSNRLVL